MSRSVIFFLLIATPVLAVGLTGLGILTLRTNLLGWFLVFMGVAYIIGGPLYIWKRRGEPPASQEERGDRSFWLIQPGFILAVFGAPLEYMFAPTLLPRLFWMQIVGLLLIIAGVFLLSWARRVIRGQFSGHVRIQEGHQLIQSGPYRLVRHPGYLGYLVIVLGIAVGFSSLLAIASMILLLLPGLIYRMRVEEKMLVEAFGKEYQQYARRTKRLLPGIW